MLHNLENKNGYIRNEYMLLYYPEHPYKQSNGCVYLHRLVMENYLDRYLESDEQVHHINNNPLNNDIENLELMTTSTHSKLHQILNGHQIIQEKSCKQCNKLFKPSHKHIEFCCPKCSQLYRRKVDRPTKEELHKLVWSTATINIAAQFDVSDHTIAKWCKSYGISKPPVGYWNKVYSGKIQPVIPIMN